MNFRKLLLNRCEKQFYKLLEKEQTKRRSRRQSMEEAELMLEAEKKEAGGADSIADGETAASTTKDWIAEKLKNPKAAGTSQSH